MTDQRGSPDGDGADEIVISSEGEDVVLVRRIDRRLEARAKSDRPWLRRIVGLLIIGAAFYYGWKILNRKSEEIIKFHAERNRQLLSQEQTLEAVAAATNRETPAPASEKPGPISTGPDLSLPVPLDAATVTTISECTKRVNAFRQIDLDPTKITNGEATIESIFSPVFNPDPARNATRSRRTVNLQNVRIRTKTGEELRLHAAPKTQTGRLYLKLFRVANDGLPEEIAFPAAIKDLDGQPLSETAVTRFLMLSENPGRALEVERHESWSYPEKAGAQVIWSGDRIYDMQVFMPDKFLACSRGDRAGQPTMNCKCVDRTENRP